MKNYTYTKLKYYLLFFLLFISVISPCQNDGYILDDDVFIKKSRINSKPIFMRSNMGKVRFHGRAGGVSFEEVAVPSEQLEDIDVVLDYNPRNTDGQRLTVKFKKGNTYTTEISDWQLVPIAKYADDEYNVVVTLLGENNGFLNGTQYHEAFEDNLLGLRLFQADLLFTSMGRSLWDLPRVPETREILLADSEKKFEPSPTKKREYRNIYEKIKQKSDNHKGTYVLTDWGEEIKFDVVRDRFFLTGEPYYLLTKQDRDSINIISELCDVINIIPDDAKFYEDRIFKDLKYKICTSEVYSWQLDEISKSLSDIVSDHKNYEYEDYLQRIRNITRNAPNRYTLDYNSLKNDDKFQQLKQIIDFQDSPDLAVEVEEIIKELNKQYNEAYDSDYIEKIKNYIDKNESSLNLDLKQDSTFNELKKLIQNKDDCTVIEKIRELIDNLGEKNQIGQYYDVGFVKNLTRINQNELIKRLKEVHLVWYPPTYIGEMLSMIDASPAPDVDFQWCATNNLKDSNKLIHQYNPAVYDSSTKVMRYAAFFRYVKENNPRAWKKFMRKIKKIDDITLSSDPDNPINEGILTPN